VVPVKGTDLLIDAFLLFDATAPVELYIAGYAGSRWAEELVARVAASHHTQKVRFLGFQADPDAFLSTLDVFVLPSRSEGMSNALLEAMASGLPSIATDVGSNAALLQNNPVAGLVCKPTVTELYDRMLTLYEDESLRAKLGRAAQVVAETEYSLEKMIDGYRGLYIDLLTS
jgi:glycosyltransferase involved in cell wall biosynthesis